MTQVKIKYIVLFFMLILLSCSTPTQNRKNIKGQAIAQNSISNKYCFNQIIDSLEIDVVTPSHKIYAIDYPSFKEEKNRGHFKKFDEFTEFSSEIEAFLISTEDKPFLVLIGKALGATGIGADYWNYCFGKLDAQKRYEFSSLAKSPFSIFIDESNNLRYIELDDNYPRPADGKDVALDYLPLTVSIHDVNSGQSEFSFDFKCIEN